MVRFEWRNSLIRIIVLCAFIAVFTNTTAFSEGKGKAQTTIDFEEETVKAPPAKFLAPPKRSYGDKQEQLERDYLILSSKGKTIIVSVPDAVVEMKPGDFLVLLEKDGSKLAQFKVTKVKESKVLAKVVGNIAPAIQKTLLGRSVFFQPAKK